MPVRGHRESTDAKYLASITAAKGGGGVKQLKKVIGTNSTYCSASATKYVVSLFKRRSRFQDAHGVS